MAMNPMEQFAVKPLVAEPILHIAGHPIYFTNQALWMLIVVAAVASFMLFAIAPPRRRADAHAVVMAEISYEFVANMLGNTTGEDGLRFFPFVFTLFMFVLFSNFIGLLPGSFSVTGQIIVTFAMAALVILVVIVTGFLKHGMLRFLMLFCDRRRRWYILWLRSRSSSSRS